MAGMMVRMRWGDSAITGRVESKRMRLLICYPQTGHASYIGDQAGAVRFITIEIDAVNGDLWPRLACLRSCESN